MTARTRGPEQEGAPAQPEYDAARRHVRQAAPRPLTAKTKHGSPTPGRPGGYEAQAHADEAPEPAWWDGERMTTGRGREAEEEPEAGS